MIETVLFFALGFLCAALLALIVAPSIWRRAVVLTRRRLEASMPLTRDEITADKDRQRAEFAMTTRRLEIALKETREKSARQQVELARSSQALSDVTGERDEKAAAIADLEAKLSQAQEESARQAAEISNIQGELAMLGQRTQARAGELERMEALYEEASLISSSRQIEIVAREADIDKLSAELVASKRAGKDLERRLREAAGETRTEAQALRDQKRRVAELERRVERDIARMSDMEERLERREKELARLRARARGRADPPSTGAGEEDEMDRLRSERDRMETRIATLMQENRALRTGGGSGDGGLREEIGEIAAEIVAMAAAREGPNGPIAAILEADAGKEGDGGKASHVSLARRIRARAQPASSDAT